MHISQLTNSSYLKKEDCDPEILVTISHVDQVNVAKEGAPQDMKWCIHFDEVEKGMILNSTNGQLIAKITGSEESDEWSGQQIVLYHDPSVSFGGKLMGGIRVRAPKKNTVKSSTTAKGRPADEDEAPF